MDTQDTRPQHSVNAFKKVAYKLKEVIVDGKFWIISIVSITLIFLTILTFSRCLKLFKSKGKREHQTIMEEQTTTETIPLRERLRRIYGAHQEGEAV